LRHYRAVRHSSPVLPAIRVGGSLHSPKLVFFNQILAAHQAGSFMRTNTTPTL